MTGRVARALAAAILVATAVPAIAEDAPSAPPLRVETVADGVWAAVRPAAARFDTANAAFIVTGRDVVVVDPPPEPAAARQFREAIRERTALPVRYAVLTHWHGDHSFGVAALRAAFPDAEIVAHRTVAEDLRTRAASQLAEEIAAWTAAIEAAEARLENGVDRAGQALDAAGKERLAEQIEAAEATVAGKRATEIVAPTLAIDGPMTLARGGRRIEIVPHRAHTRGDLVIHLPAERVLISGDVVDDLPFAGHGYLASWIETLDDLAALEVEAIVPGHGPVFRGTERIGQIRALLTAATAQAAAAVERGLEGEAAAAAVDLASFRPVFVTDGDEAAERNFAGFVPALAERAVAEAAGTAEAP